MIFLVILKKTQYFPRKYTMIIYDLFMFVTEEDIFCKQHFQDFLFIYLFYKLAGGKEQLQDIRSHAGTEGESYKLCPLIWNK